MNTYTRVFSQTCLDVNKAILAGFSDLTDEDFKSRTHLFHGRYENLYLDADRIPGLALIVDTAMQEAARILGMDVAQLASGFWLNAMHPGDVTTAHTHDDDDELLSCVYYIRVPAEADRSGQLIITQNDGEEVIITPREGMFVFFSPQTLHEVTKNETDEMRLSMAFNFGKKR
ncbi:MAG: 2OG-Fe(II) oxygenase family protein [Gammaproteobacteria bacterium]|nr:2OG-Fe(II) oxygenase family protein [Gammaproteobacteria bacterium]